MCGVKVPAVGGGLPARVADRPPGHADTLTAQLRAFAHRSGLMLDDVYTEHPDVPASREGAAFRALVEALRHPTYVRSSFLCLSTSRGSAVCTGSCIRLIAVETGADIVIMSKRGGGTS